MDLFLPLLIYYGLTGRSRNSPNGWNPGVSPVLTLHLDSTVLRPFGEETQPTTAYKHIILYVIDVFASGK